MGRSLTLLELIPSTGPCANPGRGWYGMTTFAVHEPPVFPAATGEKPNTLALVRLWFGARQDAPLDEADMAHLDAIFRWHRDHGMDMILRPTYDIDGHGIEHEPARAALVETHLRQLGQAAAPYAANILLVQGALLGSWGEMHASKFLSRPHLERLINAARESFPPQVFLAVRQGAQWRTLCSRRDQGAETRMGLFNDALFGSETDLGTYGTQTAEEAGWQGHWTPAEERAFIRDMHMNRPFGGETAWGEEMISPVQALDTLAQLRATYLSREWDSRVLDAWRAAPCGKGGIWQDVSVFDYIGAHLGYRFVVRDCKLHSSLLARRLTVRFRLVNEGFAPLMQPAALALVGTDPRGAETLYPLDADLRALAPGAALELSQELPPQTRRLCLRLYRLSDGHIIRPAHENLTPDGNLPLAEIADEK